MSMFGKINEEEKIVKNEEMANEVAAIAEEVILATPKKRGRPSKKDLEAAKKVAEEADEIVAEEPAKKSKATPKKKISDSESAAAKAAFDIATMFDGRLSADKHIDFKINIEVQYLKPALGVSSSSKEMYAEYIASKAPNAASTEEEIEAIGEDGKFMKGTSIYHRTRAAWDEKTGRYRAIKPESMPRIPEGMEIDENHPYVYDYQVRGFFKEAFSAMQRASKSETGNKDVKFSTITAFKKAVDLQMFIEPRNICLNIPEYYYDTDGITRVPSFKPDGMLQTLQRSLRTSGPTGKRVAIASSEMVPAGTSFKFTIKLTDKSLWPATLSALNYGFYHGFSGWRNSGLGSFKWRPVDEHFQPYSGMPNDGWNIADADEDDIWAD